MTGKQLTNSILQWAIQGKLVPQDPNDEPASVLLEKIRAEKARLIKEGKIKKDKKESIIYRGEDNSYYEKFTDGKVVCIDEEIPFEIPPKWVWCRLNNLADIVRGGSPRPAGSPEYYNGNIPFLKVADLTKDSQMFVRTHTATIKEAGLKKTRMVSANTLLLTNSGATLGVPKICTFETTFNDGIAAFLYLTEELKPYLYWFLCAMTDIFRNINQGTAQPNLNTDIIKDTLFAMPPIEEQRRIINKIEELIPTIDKYSLAQNKLSQLNSDIYSCIKKSVLYEAIQGRLVPQDASDEPATILLQRIKEEKLRLVKEGKLKKKDVIDSTIFRGDDNKYYEQVDGTTLQIELEYTFPETWEVVRLTHICRFMDGEKKEGDHVCLDAKYLRGKSSGEILPKGKFVSTGDNIILVDGENSGEVFAVPHDGYMGSTFKQLWVSNNMHLPYVLYFIQFYKDLLRNSKKGAAIPHLNKEIFYSLVVGIPPYQEQERIANAIGELYARL